MRKKSKNSISKIQRSIWQECRRIKDKPIVDCYTCGAKDLQGSNKQLGHMWSKATLGASLKYELDILEWQCFRCNINGGGMGADFYKRKLKELGKNRMTELEQMRNKTVKAMDYYIELLEKYKNL
ncbi:MAG TPA: hypothetical protein DCS12_08575 [Clostridiales bacterium]|nr:hypothetical protein [Clostridiales bacterium]